ncbi:hypothetical protein GCM10028811_08210 [Uliginosibacterium sediminicola]
MPQGDRYAGAQQGNDPVAGIADVDFARMQDEIADLFGTVHCVRKDVIADWRRLASALSGDQAWGQSAGSGRDGSACAVGDKYFAAKSSVKFNVLMKRIL